MENTLQIAIERIASSSYSYSQINDNLAKLTDGNGKNVIIIPIECWDKILIEGDLSLMYTQKEVEIDAIRFVEWMLDKSKDNYKLSEEEHEIEMNRTFKELYQLYKDSKKQISLLNKTN